MGPTPTDGSSWAVCVQTANLCNTYGMHTLICKQVKPTQPKSTEKKPGQLLEYPTRSGSTHDTKRQQRWQQGCQAATPPTRSDPNQTPGCEPRNCWCMPCVASWVVEEHGMPQRDNKAGHLWDALRHDPTPHLLPSVAGTLPHVAFTVQLSHNQYQLGWSAGGGDP